MQVNDYIIKWIIPANCNWRVLWFGTTTFAETIFIVRPETQISVLQQMRKILRATKFEFTSMDRQKIIQWIQNSFNVIFEEISPHFYSDPLLKT